MKLEVFLIPTKSFLWGNCSITITKNFFSSYYYFLIFSCLALPVLAYLVLWQRNLLKLPVHKDIARLSKNLIIVDAQQRVVRFKIIFSILFPLVHRWLPDLFYFSLFFLCFISFFPIPIKNILGYSVLTKFCGSSPSGSMTNLLSMLLNSLSLFSLPS